MPRCYCPSQNRPSVIIFTSLPPASGLTKIVSFAEPRLRFRIEEFGVIRSSPSLAHPCAFRFALRSAQALFTGNSLLKLICSTRDLYSTSVASLVSATSLAFRPGAAGFVAVLLSASTGSDSSEFGGVCFVSVDSATWYSFGISPNGATNLTLTSHVAKDVCGAVRSQFSLHLAVRILEIVCLDRADRTEVLVLKRAV